MIRPELLSPAGDMEKLEAAIAWGADAVYLAGEEYGMRTSSQNFTVSELYEAVRRAHKAGVLVYVAVNTMPRNDEVDCLPGYLEQVQDAGADALIIADLGVFQLARRYAPQMKRHVSTQASIVNYETAQAWFELGAERVVLARELSIDEICDIREKTDPRLELEVFVHGAMCMAYSGRCMLSNYLAGRDANQGNCAQPCRWQYAVVEEKRPGEYFPIDEDRKGTYLFNSKDLCMVRHIPELLDVGIASFKIEGRVKSAYYNAVVTNAYRMAIDAYLQNPADWNPDGVWAEEVEKVSHRQYYTGFYFGETPSEYRKDSIYIRSWDVAAKVLECGPDGAARVVVKNRIVSGDQLELLEPGCGPIPFVAGGMEDADGNPIACARHATEEILLPLPKQAVPGALVRVRRDEDRGETKQEKRPDASE